MSLKSQILYLIKSQGEVGIDSLEELCRQENYKISNYERRCRELMATGSILPIKNPKGAIIGYHKTTQAPCSVSKPKVDIQSPLFNLPLKSPYDY